MWRERPGRRQGIQGPGSSGACKCRMQATRLQVGRVLPSRPDPHVNWMPLPCRSVVMVMAEAAAAQGPSRSVIAAISVPKDTHCRRQGWGQRHWDCKGPQGVGSSGAGCSKGPQLCRPCHQRGSTGGTLAVRAERTLNSKSCPSTKSSLAAAVRSISTSCPLNWAAVAAKGGGAQRELFVQPHWAHSASRPDRRRLAWCRRRRVAADRKRHRGVVCHAEDELLAACRVGGSCRRHRAQRERQRQRHLRGRLPVSRGHPQAGHERRDIKQLGCCVTSLASNSGLVHRDAQQVAETLQLPWAGGGAAARKVDAQHGLVASCCCRLQSA